MRLIAVPGVALVLAWLPCIAGADVRELFPGDDFEQAAESLRPGDTLILHAGDYVTTGRISIGVQGTATEPVVIKGADGEALPHIRRPATAAAQNTINIEGARYLTLSRLEISSNGGDGINLNGNPAFITLEELEIHDIDVGVNFRSSMNDIVVRRTHIHRTGGGDGTGTGEGMYVGCNDAACIVRNSLIENNWIHDTRNSTQGDGIEVKLGSHSNIVRDNVIYNTGYPCILVYGTGTNPVNVIEGNVMWQCGDSGIQAAADAIIRNNIIIDSPNSNGFNSQPHQAAVPRNLQFVHNTLVGGSPCVRLSNWSGRPGLVFANNAIYCDGDDFAIGGLAGVTVAGNVFVPATSSFPSAGYRVGQSTALDLTDLAARNVYPSSGSRLIDAGQAAHATAVDFNGQARSGTPDAGAYERTAAANPGWVVKPGFKNQSARVPTVTLSADPLSVPSQGSTTLTWTSADATACTASGAWSGAKPLEGSEVRGPLAGSSTFTLACSGPAGTADRSVTVTVGAAAPVPTLDFSASPTSVATGVRTTLTWSSTHATGCSASGSWSGNKAAAGTEQSAPLTAAGTFALACTGAGGTTERSVTVAVVAGAGGGDGSGGGGGGGGAIGMLTLFALCWSFALGSAVPVRRRGLPMAWLSAGAALLCAVPAHAQIVQAQIRSTSAAEQQQVPVTFGQVFKRGDVPQAAVLRATLDGSQSVPLQVDAKARHADGSLRHALLTASTPSLAASAVRVLSIDVGGTAPAGNAVTVSDVLATAFDATVALDIAGVRYTASARSLLEAGGAQVWMTGPLASEWIVSGPVRRADNTAHPHLAARFEIRAYAGAQRIRVGVTVENAWAFASAPQRYTYDLTVNVSGKGNVLARPGLVHYRQSRWRRTFWWGAEAFTDVQHDTRYLMASGAVPTYQELTVPGSTLNAMVSNFANADDLMQIGNLAADMPGAGGRWEIAPLPGFAARYLVSEDPRAKLVTVGHGEQAGSWPMHFRDQQTDLPLSLDNHPNATIMGGSGVYGSFPACGGNCSVPYTPEVAHHPSLAYVPYLITGDYYFLEELQFWASWVLMYGPASNHGFSQGLLVWDQIRGQAWGLRTLGQAAYATPDGHPLKSYFLAKLDNNLDYYNANWLDSNPLGYMTLTGPMSGLGLSRWIATWMDDFLTWSFGHLVQLGFEDARPMRDWKAKFPVGRMTHPDMCWILASTYWPTVMDNFYLGGTGQPVRTWADWRRIIILSWQNDAFPADAKGNLPGQLQNLLNASCNSPQMSAALGLPQNWMIGYGGDPEGYPANLQPALATAVDAGLPDATEAWNTFRNAASYPDYRSDPQWAVVPTATVASGPSLTFSASPSSVATGGSSTLNWSTGNATSCVASGDWSGNKAVSGSQNVGPLARSSTYRLDCSNATGTISRSVTVSVGSSPPPPPPPAAPVVTLTADPPTVATGASATLSWSATDATACNASGGWTGSRNTAGSASTGALAAATTFTLTCSGPGGSGSASTTVNVSAPSGGGGGGGGGSDSGGGGGGLLGLGTLLFASALAGLRLRRLRSAAR